MLTAQVRYIILDAVALVLTGRFACVDEVIDDRTFAEIVECSNADDVLSDRLYV